MVNLLSNPPRSSILILFLLISLVGSIPQPYGWRWRVLTIRLSLASQSLHKVNRGSLAWDMTTEKDKYCCLMDSEISQYEEIKQ